MEISYEVTSLIEATRKAVAAGEAKDYFLSNISHEIRTPLNAILGFVSLLEDEVNSERHRQYLNIIHNSGETLLSIINDILDFSKLQSGEFKIDARPFNVHEELSKTLELFVSSANEKQITLLSYFDPKIPHILVGDILRIKQIVSNFISNAIKFSPQGVYIEVRVTCKDSNLKISVEDWGVGLDDTDIKRIFDPFSQVKSSVAKLIEGTGLGLSICKKLAEHMQGDISVVSQKGKGSTFSISVPVTIQETSRRHLFDPEPFKKQRMALLRFSDTSSQTLSSLEYYLDFFGFSYEYIDIDAIETYELILFLEEEVDPRSDATLMASSVPMIAIMEHLSDRYDHIPHITPLFFPFYCSKIYTAFQQSLHHDEVKPSLNKRIQRRFKGRVLVAEDNQANQELIKVILERYGLSYKIVSNGEEALKVFREALFDIVLMDEQMPLKNGLETTAAIIAFEKKQRRTHTPIIAITANVIKGAKERGMEYGYDAFLGKPIIIKEIERVFELYLHEEASQNLEGVHDELYILGGAIDCYSLQQELQIDGKDLKMLLKIYAKKMEELLPELQEAIHLQRFDKIAKLAHTVKGSSANFRLSEVQRLAGVIEESAMAKEKDFAYREALQVLQEEYDKLALKVTYASM
jgi:CheY-like chemotaxis protein/two-component sensor histidine kinase